MFDIFRPAQLLIVVSVLTGCHGKDALHPAPPAQTVPRPAVGPMAPAVPVEAKDAAPGGGERRILITIDDLPLAMYGDYESREERRETVKNLVGMLERRNVPFVGFFNMRWDAQDPQLTKTWLTASKLTPGNHTWSHPNARKTPLDAYLRDLEKGHRAVSEIAGEKAFIPFRFPYLNQGFDAEKRDAIFAKLESLESPHVPATIDTMDWLHARGWLDARHDGDEELAAKFHQAWLWSIQESTLEAERWADELFEHTPPQIVLLHANRLNAEHLDEALDWWEGRGYQFVTWREALADPAFQERDESLSPIGETHWVRLRRSRSQSVSEPGSATGPPNTSSRTTTAR